MNLGNGVELVEYMYAICLCYFQPLTMASVVIVIKYIQEEIIGLQLRKPMVKCRLCHSLSSFTHWNRIEVFDHVSRELNNCKKVKR